MKETIEVTKKYRFFKGTIKEKIYVQGMDTVREFSFPYLIRAQNLKEATNRIYTLAKEWFDEEEYEDVGGGLEYFNGTVLLLIGSIKPITFKEFTDDLLADSFIDCRPGDNKIRK